MQKLKDLKDKIFAWCKDSGTILFARLQIAAAVVWGVASVTDLTPLLPPKYLTMWLLFSGVTTELVRRRKASFDPVK